jgi:NADH:ubiquinone oxidoreductase subunit E
LIIARLSIERAHVMENIVNIIEKHHRHPGGLISILQEIQANYSYLPEEALRVVARETGASLVDVYGVATFYKSFSLKPRGKHLVTVCAGTACHVRGAVSIIQEFEKNLKIRAGGTTADNGITLETVNCLGACALGPIVVVDGHYFSNVTMSKVKDIIEKAKTGLDKIEFQTDDRIFPVEVNCPDCGRSLMDSDYLIDDYPSIGVRISFNLTHGRLKLSCLYGSHHIELDCEVPPDTVTRFFCPHCNAEFLASGNCIKCDAPMVPMIVRGGGIVQICSRRGCKEHMLDLG